MKVAGQKLPTIVLLAFACAINLSGPVKEISLIQEPETEVADSLKVKEFCRQEHASRRLRQKQAHHPLWRKLKPPDTNGQPPGIDRPPVLKINYYSSSPPLRAPPAES